MVFKLWNQLVDAICRPPRDIYDVENQLPGGRLGRFQVHGNIVQREDFSLQNKKNQMLLCSIYRPQGVKSKQADNALPTVIYCHCNSGSRRDAAEAIGLLCPMGISVLALDFSGSGLSEGDYVTLGANECEDLEVVVDHLRAKNLASTLGLWGRSMGAVTSLMYTSRDPSVAGVVADSPFSHLPDLLLEIVQDQKLPIPNFLLRFVLFLMKRSVRSRAKFDLDKVSPVDVMRTAFIPAVFGHGKDDDFIRPHHSQRLHDSCSSVDKRLLLFDGTHNSPRPEYFYSNVSQFFHQSLRLDDMIEGGNQLERQILGFGGGAVRHVSSIPNAQHESRPGAPAWVGHALDDAAASLCADFVEGEASNLNLEQTMASIRRWGESARLEMQSARGGVISELMRGSLSATAADGEGRGEEAAAAGSVAEEGEEDDEVTRQMMEAAIRMSLLDMQEKKPPDEGGASHPQGGQ